MFKETVFWGVVGVLLLLHAVQAGLFHAMLGQLLLQLRCEAAYLVGAFVGLNGFQPMAWPIDDVMDGAQELLL